MHKSEQNSLHLQTCVATLSLLHPQMCRCAATFSSLNKALVLLQLKLIHRIGVASEIKIITMNPEYYESTESNEVK